MKVRNGFVSNSSSTSFIITNKTNAPIPWCEFVNETKEVVLHFAVEYGEVSGIIWKYIIPHNDLEIDSQTLGDNRICSDLADIGNGRFFEWKRALDDMCRDCRGVDDIQPGDMVAVFGDEDGTLIGEVYDYSLRYGGETDRFRWRLHEHLR